MIYILYTNLSKECYDKVFNEKLERFPLNFKNKLLRYRRWQDAQASLFGRLLLKQGLKYYFDYDLTFDTILYNKYSKPYIINRLNLDFNISHSGDYVCCAISNDSKVGIDIEKMDCNINIRDFNNQMTEFEINKIKESENYVKAFYKYWTQKETVIKLEGKGLSIPLKSFEVKNQSTYVSGNDIHLKEIHIDDSYVCNIASYNKINSKKIKISNKNLCVDY